MLSRPKLQDTYPAAHCALLTHHTTDGRGYKAHFRALRLQCVTAFSFSLHPHLRCKHLCLEADQCSSRATADPGRPLPLPSVSARLASFTPLALSSPPHLASASATPNAVVAGSQRTKANRPVDSVWHYLAHPSVSLRATVEVYARTAAYWIPGELLFLNLCNFCTVSCSTQLH